MKTFKAVALALFGTLIEYYDYALYGFAAPILALHFFPKNDPDILLLQAYGIFFAGSCSKPLGSLIFGFIGDRFGRAFALKLSIFGITIPTVIIGLLPDYQTWGWTAAALLFLCRILQGIFVSGESDNARVFIFESLPKKYRCFSNSVAYCLCMLGIYWASFSLNSLFSEESSYSTNIGHILTSLCGIPIDYWRLPFLVAGLFGIFLFLLRRNLKETQPFLGLTSENRKKNGFHIFPFIKINKISILLTLLMTGAAGGQYHFYFVFLNSYLGKVLNTTEILFTSISPVQQSQLLLIFALCLPVSGFLADRLSSRFSLISLLKASSIMIIGLAILNLIFMLVGYLPYEIMLLTAVALSFSQANTFVLILKQFTVQERCRGISVGHALGSMLLSGSTPFISLSIWNITQIPTAPFVYFLFLCFISYIALLFIERKQKIANPLFLSQYAIQP